MQSFRIEFESGTVLECSPEFVRPFTLQDLLDTPSAGSHTYTLELGSPRLTRTVDGVTTVEPGVMKGPVTFKQPIPIYALVNGGWLPPPFVLSNRFLVDRNVIEAFVALGREDLRSDHLSTGWWLELLESSDVVLNPLPHAMEGPFRRTPTFEEFASEFERASAEIKLRMPSAKVVTFEDRHSRAAFQMVTNLRERTADETQFLMETVPLVVNQVSARATMSTEREILAYAQKHNLSTRSLPVVAVLSCLHETPLCPGASPGRLVIKPKVGYGPQEAYNALADLKHLELLIASRTLSEKPGFALCTCDKGLAIFWCAISANQVKAAEEEDGFTFDLSLDSGLFPGLDDAGLDRLSKVLVGDQ